MTEEEELRALLAQQDEEIGRLRRMTIDLLHRAETAEVRMRPLLGNAERYWEGRYRDEERVAANLTAGVKALTAELAEANERWAAHIGHIEEYRQRIKDLETIVDDLKCELGELQVAQMLKGEE